MFIYEILLYFVVEIKRLEFVKRICPITPTSLTTHVIQRKAVFQDTITLLKKDKVLEEFPLKIKFEDEPALDYGGVCRELFSAFWEQAYLGFFEGSNLLSPCLHANSDMASLPLLGRVLSHGYLVCGFLPVRVAFPCLAAIILSPGVDLSQKILVQSFAESLCSSEAATIKQALASTTFSKELKDKLICIFSHYGSMVSPTPSGLRVQIYNIAKYHYTVKPMAAICSIGCGIPSNEKEFWDSFTVEELYSLYLSLSATPEKVLSILDEPLEENSSQARIFAYLQQYVGNMKNEEARRFLRYTTGSSVLTGRNISVSFNGLSGLARRPIAHTCGYELELPSTYVNYMEFEKEFNAILADDEYAWNMYFA